MYPTGCTQDLSAHPAIGVFTCQFRNIEGWIAFKRFHPGWLFFYAKTIATWRALRSWKMYFLLKISSLFSYWMDVRHSSFGKKGDTWPVFFFFGGGEVWPFSNNHGMKKSWRQETHLRALKKPEKIETKHDGRKSNSPLCSLLPSASGFGVWVPKHLLKGYLEH